MKIFSVLVFIVLRLVSKTTGISVLESESEKCQDKLDNCNDYSDRACDEIFRPWAIANCPERCGYCQQEGPTCIDRFDCQSLPSDLCTNIGYNKFVQRFCRKFCNLCHDINECDLDLDDCDNDKATCINTRDGYKCRCNKGFEGDGKTCYPENLECYDKLDICYEFSDEACDDVFRSWAEKNCPKRCGYCQSSKLCRDHFNCSMLPDVVCTYPLYRTLALKSCRKYCNLCSAAINECELGLDDCDKTNAVCFDEENGYRCQCTNGFVGDGRKCVAPFKPEDCQEIKRKYPYSSSGVYDIFPMSDSKSVRIFCEMDEDGGGWTIIQNRFDGSVEFHRNWTEYKNGFGNVSGEYWLGNDLIHKMTNKHSYSLRINLGDWEGNKAFEHYSSFSIGDEGSDYRLHVSGSSGNAGQSFQAHNGLPFSASDRDNDNLGLFCSNYYMGG